MSNRYSFTNEQKKLLEYCYCHPRTYSEVADHLGCDVKHVQNLISFPGAPDFLNVDFHNCTDHSDAAISLNHDGIVLVESIRSDRSDRHRLTRRFWIEILLGGLLGWFLSAFGTPKNLLDSISQFFR